MTGAREVGEERYEALLMVDNAHCIDGWIALATNELSIRLEERSNHLQMRAIDDANYARHFSNLKCSNENAYLSFYRLPRKSLA